MEIDHPLQAPERFEGQSLGKERVPCASEGRSFLDLGDAALVLRTRWGRSSSARPSALSISTAQVVASRALAQPDTEQIFR